MRFSLLVVALAAFVLTACEGKKSLDGYPMDKPPPSAYGARDSEPIFPEPEVAELDEEAAVSGADDDAAEESEASGTDSYVVAGGEESDDETDDSDGDIEE